MNHGPQMTTFKSFLSWEIAAMLAKVVVVGARHIVAQGVQDLTNYSILSVKLRKKEIFKYSKYVLLRKKNKYSQTDTIV
jgi:hypothetical protein